MGQLIKNVDSRVKKQMQSNRKKIHRRRYITLNEFERIKSVLLKNKIYITRSKLAMRLKSHNEYFIFDDNNKMPLLDIHHSSLSIFTSQTKKKIWHFNDLIEEEIESIYERKKLQENTFSETREAVTDTKSHELTLFIDNKFSDETISSTEINYQPVEKYHLIITPFIRPLLSEVQIYDIQEAQKECTQRDEYDRDLKTNAKLQQEELKERLSRSPVKGRALSLTSDKGQQVTSPTLGIKRGKNESPTGRKVGFQGDAVETKKRGRSAERKTKEPQSNKPRDKSHKKKSPEIFRDRKSKDRGRKETHKGRIARVSEKKAKGTRRMNMEDKDEKGEFDTKHKTIASESRTTNKTQNSKEKFATDKSVKSKEKMSLSREELIKTNDLDKSKSDIHKKSKSDIHTKFKSDTSKSITPERKLRKSLEYDPIHRGGTSVKSKSIIKRTNSETSKGTKKVLTGSESKKSKKTVFDVYTIYYQLSDKKFIQLGWTLEPRDSEFARIVTFQTHAANSHKYAFRDRECIEEKFYPDGKLAYRFELNSTGKVLYKSGHPAMTFTQNYLGRRVTIFSEPTNDIVKGYTKSKLLAVFDSYGNGVVYNDCGDIRLNYDQAEGIVYESHSEKPFKWQWKDYEIIQKKRMVVMLQSLRNEVVNPKANKVKKPLSSKQTTRKSTYPQIIDELPYPHIPTVKLKKQKYDNTFSPIILKLTNEMTLRIIGQDNIVLSYDSMKIRLRLDLGVIIEPNVEVRMDDMDVESKVENVPCVFEVLLKKTPSLVKIKNELCTLRLNSKNNVKNKKK